LAPTKLLGLAGASTAIAEGVDGTQTNAAAPAVRPAFSYSWLDLDVGVGVSFPGSYTNTDFDNSGSYDRSNDFFYFNAGATAQFGAFGTSLTGEFLRYDVQGQGTGPSLSVTAGRYHGLVAYGIADGQFVVGGGVRAVSMLMSQSGGQIPSPSPTILTMTGLSPEVGVEIKPNFVPYRFGVTVRAPVSGSAFGSSSTTTDALGVTRAGSLILPQRITLPWEFETGFALQVGPRPLNPSWINPHDHERLIRERVATERARRAREYERILDGTPPDERAAKSAELAREELAIRVIEDQHVEAEARQLMAERKARFANWPRERILFLASVLVTGATENAVSLEGFLGQQNDGYGRSTTVSPRVGIEAEPIANILKSRLGSYLEPSLFPTGHLRQHFTFGGDVRLLPFDTFGLTKDQVWRLSFAVDLAPRYINWGLSLGAWH
jgi:hypothetical protein